MEIVRLPPDALLPGQRLNFSLRDAAGNLLFANGVVLPNTPAVREMLERGVYVLARETEAYRREANNLTMQLFHQNAALSEIAKVKPDFNQTFARSAVVLSEPAAWSELQLQLHNLLRDPKAEGFLGRLEALREEAVGRLRRNPDQALLLLVHEASQELMQYTARHALLCMVLCELVGDRLAWPLDHLSSLGRAALTMNLSLGLLQDRLAQQREALSQEQRRQLQGHGGRSAELLASLGVTDPLWLTAVRLHHDTAPGPLSSRPEPERLARLLQRIDTFAAQLAPRISRKAHSGVQASRAIFLDEAKQQDEAGAALIKALGLYPPGTLVRLANGEDGIVLKRGAIATDPLVAALIGKSGAPLTSPVPRDTRLSSQAVVTGLAPHELKLRLSIDKLLRLY